ncbi:transporter substrate-binding domain-containing protein [Fulvivirga maritima]|uniref:transporter substrate-binding domain-containing protein n=1 Tax=Fulvivirga maritima TaxID=2904247 RepID=UPI001F1CDA46|nr:transporter substrate-binding domain-containing protein [Fulvivirga maritima]UII28709.1 transporter substrate-binding domain-containing protein [Fulvivirga maritima]
MALSFYKNRPLYYLCFVLVMVFMAGCHKTTNESTEPEEEQIPAVRPVDFDLERIKKRGSIIAIVDNSSTGYFLYRGRPMGYEYDLLSLYAEQIGVTLEIKVTTSIDEAFDMLNNGEGDIIAYSLAITKARKEIVDFTHSHYTTRQVLVQRKPRNWRRMTRAEIDKKLIRNQVDLIGKEVHVRKSSSFVDRLQNLSDEIGGDVLIIEEQDSAESEELIRQVAFSEIDYTIADETMALVNASYYPILDVRTDISFPQQIAWAVRKNSDQLLNSLNEWIVQVKKKPTFNIIYNKYFKSPRASLIRAKSSYSSMGGEKISVYDDIIKVAADSLGWDWQLLAAQIYQESHFDPNVESWAGAIGLMQIVPETGERYGATDLTDPVDNIMAGVNLLRFLDDLWSKTIKDADERLKFVLASYNVGLGHVVDARELAKKYGRDPLKWDDNVEYFLLMKSKPEFFRDPVVKSGYCRGEEPVNYVKEILNRYQQYRQLITT